MAISYTGKPGYERLIPGERGKRLTGFVVLVNGEWMTAYHKASNTADTSMDIKKAQHYIAGKGLDKYMENGNAKEIAQKLGGTLIWLVNGEPEARWETDERLRKWKDAESGNGFAIRVDGKYLKDTGVRIVTPEYTVNLSEAKLYALPNRTQLKNYNAIRIAKKLGGEVVRVLNGKVQGEPEQKPAEEEPEEATPAKFEKCKFYITKMMPGRVEYYLRSATIDKNRCKCYSWSPKWKDRCRYSEYGKAKRIMKACMGEMWAEFKNGEKEKIL